MAKKLFSLNKFYGGIVRDQKSQERGVALNVEELDIFSQGDYIQAEQIFTADSLPASTEVYAYTAGDNDTVYAYGKETGAGKVRLLSVATGGADNPGAFSTLFTSSDSTNLAYTVSDIHFHRTTEANPNYLYYVTDASGTVKLKRYDISGDSESTVGTLSGLDGSFDRPTMRSFYGELFVCHGKFIAKVDGDGTFTEKAFTLPNDAEAVDIVPASDVAIILTSRRNREQNDSIGYWWDLTRTEQFDDSFNLPMGNPQWIYNHKETIKIMCAQNGIAKFYQLSGAFPGAVPIELPGIRMTNIAASADEQPISPTKSVGTKDGILYFAVNKTDKTGLYALGQLDDNKRTALILSKRFDTSDYSNHSPYGVLIHGPNFYAAIDDNGTNEAKRCEGNNSPDRSSNAVYESVWFNFDEPFTTKTLEKIYLATQPLPASTSLTVSARTDFNSSYTQWNETNGGVMNATNQEISINKMKDEASGKGQDFQVKVAFGSNGTDSPKLMEIGMQLDIPSQPLL